MSRFSVVTGGNCWALCNPLLCNLMQPIWKPLDNLGDVNPIDYGGYFVLEDTTGVYPPEAVLLETDDECTEWTAHRFTLGPCTLTNGVLSDNRFHPLHPAWWADKLESIASTVGQTPAELVEFFLSENPLQRAHAYRSVIYSFGPEEFDSYPLRFKDRAEVEAYVRGLGF